MAELPDRPEWCLDLTFMHALLRLGYEFKDTREVAIGKKIQGMGLGWCLGATIAMVGGAEVSDMRVIFDLDLFYLSLMVSINNEATWTMKGSQVPILIP